MIAVEKRSQPETRTRSDALDGVAEVVATAFPRATRETQRALVATADIEAFRPRQTVVRQGDESRVGLVLEGHAGFRRTTIDGREVIPMIISRGELGPIMPIASRPFTADLLALSSGRIALWPGADVQALAAEDAGFGLDLLEHVLKAVEVIVERMDGLLYQDAARRVARVLDQHAELIFGEEGAVTRTYLPALVGTSREMTGRVLRQLESDGVVQRLGRSRLRLLDPVRLARTAAPPVTARER
jgi:CRP/FNR family cyclic AMP-dependent transcriptional regulator